MDVRRLRVGEWIAGIGGGALLGAMLLDWYSVDGSKGFSGEASSGIVVVWGEETAWQAFSVVDVALAVTAALAVALAVTTAIQRSAAVPIALASVTALVGLVAIGLVGWRAVSPPDFEARDAVGGAEAVPGAGARADVSFDRHRKAGLWLGLAACGLLTAGAFGAMRDERIPRAARMEIPVEVLTPPEGDAA